MKYDVDRELTELRKRVFDLEHPFKVPLARVAVRASSPPSWVPTDPVVCAPSPHQLGGPHHTGVGSGLERSGTTLQVDLADAWSGLEFASGELRIAEGAQFAWTALHVFAVGLAVPRTYDYNIAYRSYVPGDSTPRFYVTAGGEMYWSVGSGATDVRLYRSAADTLKLDSTLFHIFGSTVANKHIAGYYGSVTQILEKAVGCGLQIIADDGSTGASYVCLSNVPSSGDNKHWIIHHLGTSGSDRLFIGYVTSAATDFSPYSGVNEYLTISTAGAVHIIENSAAVRLTGTKQFVWTIPSPSVGTYGQVRLPWACTVTRFDGNIVGGTSCTLNVEERGTLGSAGTNVLSSDMVADANGESVTSAFNNSSLAAGNHLTIDVSAISGAVGEVTIGLTVTLT